jgi:hypothetical protein
MTLLYVMNTSRVSQKFRPYTERYMEPAFYQGWSLFAPDVATWNCKVDYRVKRAGIWEEWHYTDELEEKSHPKLTEMSVKMGHYIGYLLKDNLYFENGLAKYDKCEASGYYRMAYYMSIAHQNYVNSSPWDSLQVRARMYFPEKFGSAGADSTVFYDFPPRGINQEAP